MSNEHPHSSFADSAAAFGVAAFEALFDAIADPVFVKDAAHRFVKLNEACCRFMGRPREELLGKTDRDFFPPEEADVFWAKDDEVLASGVENVNQEAFTDAAGETHVIITKKSAWVGPQGERYIVGVIRDITERQAMENTLQEQNERLRELDILKSAFVSSVSHELRTPLTSIKGYAEFLEDEIGGPMTADQCAFVGQILEGASRLERLVDDLLDFARLESGSFRLVRQSADVVDVVARVVRAFGPQARDRRVSLESRLPDGPLRLTLDAGRIAQVLTNLVGNALKFTPIDGRVTVSAADAGDHVRISVADTGVGIAAEHLPHLFERFYQVDTSTTRQTGGTGLGLAISKALVEAHGGAIGAESTLGGGTTFWFTLPKA